MICSLPCQITPREVYCLKSGRVLYTSTNNTPDHYWTQGRSRLRCRSAASPAIMARVRPRGRWLWTRCPHPPGGPSSPPGPSGAHRPAAAAPQRVQDPRRSQKTQGHGPQLGRPLHAALTLAPALSPCVPGGCRSNRQATPWGRGSRTSVACVFLNYGFLWVCAQ